MAFVLYGASSSSSPHSGELTSQLRTLCVPGMHAIAQLTCHNVPSPPSSLIWITIIVESKFSDDDDEDDERLNVELAISHKYGLVRWMAPRTELCPPPVPDRTRSGPPIFSAYILTSSQHEDHIFSYRITTYHWNYLPSMWKIVNTFVHLKSTNSRRIPITTDVCTRSGWGEGVFDILIRHIDSWYIDKLNINKGILQKINIDKILYR